MRSSRPVATASILNPMGATVEMFLRMFRVEEGRIAEHWDPDTKE